ncbi:hypothetical protein, partial [Bradyrhizobium sp. sGM-13]|uniref:hypothetical protein n=1 Tax=Bradyrhizobium sp. sGM-13 TaxID=2831781 RepID=UPI001BCA682C
MLFPENGSFASVADGMFPTDLTAAPEPHDFAIRFLRLRLAHSASIASHRTFVTIASRPSI